MKSMTNYTAKEGEPALSHDPGRKSEMQFKTASELMKIWTPPPLIPELLYPGQFALLYAQSGAAKTLLMVYLLFCMSLGLRFFGYLIPRPLRVIYINAEGTLRNRIEGIQKYYKKNLPDTVRFLEYPWRLSDNHHRQIIIEYVNRNGGFDIIAMDTYHRVSLGLRENDSFDTGLAIEAMDDLIRETGATVIGVHHTGKNSSQGPRGSSALYAAADVVLSIKRHGRGDLRTFEVEKSRDDREGASHPFRVVEVDLGELDGARRTTAVVAEIPPSETVNASPGRPASGKSTDLNKHAESVLNRLRELAQQGELSPSSPIDLDDCIQRCKAYVVASPKHRSTRTREAINQLVAHGHLIERAGVLTLAPTTNSTW